MSRIVPLDILILSRLCLLYIIRITTVLYNKHEKSRRDIRSGVSEVYIRWRGEGEALETIVVSYRTHLILW